MPLKQENHAKLYGGDKKILADIKIIVSTNRMPENVNNYTKKDLKSFYFYITNI